MPKSSVNASLSSYDDIFSTEESRQEEQREQVQQIPIGELFPFKNHPFKVLDDDSMSDTVESVKQYGVLSPLIARPRPKGGYEIISGHRRQYAAELAGLETLPVIVREMSDDAAVILMVDSNLQREHILPSERAFAYKMKLDAIKNQGARSDLTSPQVASKFRSDDEVAKGQGISGDTVRRFIRLTNLIPELLDMVDNKSRCNNSRQQQRSKLDQNRDPHDRQHPHSCNKGKLHKEIKCIKDAGDFWSDSILPQRKIVPVSCHFKRPGNCSTGDSTDERCNRSNQHIGNDDSRQTKQLERCRHNRRHDPNAACDHRTQQDTCDCRNHPIQNLHADHSGQISVFIQNTFCLFFISSPIYHNDSPLFRFTSGIFRCTREQTSVSCRRC